MELIKQIKEAENKAKKLVEDAQKNAGDAVENAKKEYADKLRQAQQGRKEAIEAAQTQGEKEGVAEAEQLNIQSAQTRKQLEQKANTKMETAVKTVIDFIKKQS